MNVEVHDTGEVLTQNENISVLKLTALRFRDIITCSDTELLQGSELHLANVLIYTKPAATNVTA